MKLQLDNLIYTTDDELRIEKLEELGATVLAASEDEIKKEETKISVDANLENLTNAELEELIDERGIDRKGITKKADLIALLKK